MIEAEYERVEDKEVSCTCSLLWTNMNVAEGDRVLTITSLSRATERAATEDGLSRRHICMTVCVYILAIVMAS